MGGGESDKAVLFLALCGVPLSSMMRIQTTSIPEGSFFNVSMTQNTKDSKQIKAGLFLFPYIKLLPPNSTKAAFPIYVSWL